VSVTDEPGCTFTASLNKPCGDKRQIIPRIKSMPYSAGSERCHRTSKSGFLSAWSDAQVNIILEPFIGILVPCFKKLLTVLGCFERKWGDIGYAIPTARSVCVVPVESDS
jgi:hypothetical protein